MQRVSTNLTLFLKFFIPVFWLAFFGAFVIALFVYQDELQREINGQPLRFLAVIFYLTGAVLFYFTILPLKRVEMDATYVYVTNYFVAVRYPWHNVERILESRFLFFTVVTIQLSVPGKFGRKMRFIASNRWYASFWKEHPELAGLRKEEQV